MQFGQYGALPTRDRACCFATRNKCLRIHNRSATKKRWPNQRGISIDQSPLRRACQKWRCLQSPQGSLGLFRRVGDPYTVASRTAVCFQNQRKTKSSPPFFEVTGIHHNCGLRDTDVLLLGQLQKCTSLIYNRETLRRTKRTLN